MATVGVFDSGVGGLSVLRELRRLLPDERYVYYADTAFCPYGGKSAGEVIERSRSISSFLLSKGADVIVVACNTATGAAIEALREEFNVPFVGMEPAVKPAALSSVTGTIGVLATSGTLKSQKYLETKSHFASRVNIVEHVGEGFVELVESSQLEGPHTLSVVSASLSPLLEAGADRIVLGCTHYPFLAPAMSEIAGPEVEIINPAPAIARRLKAILEGTPRLDDPSPAMEFYASGSREVLDRLIEIVF